MDKVMEIRRDDRFAACGVELPAGTTAYWIRTERIVRCVPCHPVGVESQVAHAESMAKMEHQNLTQKMIVVQRVRLFSTLEN